LPTPGFHRHRHLAGICCLAFSRFSHTRRSSLATDSDADESACISPAGRFYVILTAQLPTPMIVNVAETVPVRMFQAILKLREMVQLEKICFRSEINRTSTMAMTDVVHVVRTMTLVKHISKPRSQTPKSSNSQGRMPRKSRDIFPSTYHDSLRTITPLGASEFKHTATHKHPHTPSHPHTPTLTPSHPHPHTLTHTLSHA
jgi:hypothetical protein